MFGGAKKKPAPKPRQHDLAQFGLFQMPMTADGQVIIDGGQPEDDLALEAELAALMQDGGANRRPQQKRAPKKPQLRPEDLDSMVASCMKDYSDEEVSDGEDPDLLAELEGFQSDDDDDVQVSNAKPQVMLPLSQPVDTRGDEPSLINVIEVRIAAYTEAEQIAKSNGDAARTRRYGRGLTTLKDLKKKVLTGKPVDEDDIPPAIVVPTSTNSGHARSESLQPVPTPSSQLVTPDVEQVPKSHSTSDLPETAPVPNVSVTKTFSHNPVIAQVRQRRQDCAKAAVAAKKTGDVQSASLGLKAAKECDALIAKLERGEIQTVDNLPQIPKQTVENPAPGRQFSRDEPLELPENPEDLPPMDPALFGAPPPPSSTEEALKQRLQRYRQDEQGAKKEGNDSRARRLGRICKQYEDAIRAHKAGRNIPVNDLPTPPGFAPIPIGNAVSKPMVQPQPSPTVPQSVSPRPPASSAGPVGPPTAPPATAAVAKAKAPVTATAKQLAYLEQQQALFKQAAIEAKKTGQIEQAKEYLRHMKGFEKVIEATKCGLPVDIKTLPVPPQKQKDVSMDFVVVRREDCDEDGKTISPSKLSGAERQNMYSKLEKDLVAQTQMCERNYKHFAATGDVSSGNKFQQLMEHTKKDLDALRYAFKRGDKVPRFHYEVRAFSRVVCNSDLNDTELEITVVKGLNYPIVNVKEANTYCKVEFPYPKESPFQEKTAVVKESPNPEYNHRVVIPVNPKDKSYARAFKRQSAKIEVWLKGGFLRSDTLVGSCSVKLQPLETVCEIHDSFALMNGRKAVGGKVEVKVRSRNPILLKQVEKVEEKWLVISFK